MIVISEPRRTLCALIAFCLGTVSSGQASPVEQHQGQSTPVRKSGSGSRSFFFGTSPDADLGTHAWFLYLDKAHHSGEMLIAHGMVKLSKLELRDDGSLGFQSLEFAGTKFSFSGVLKSQQIVGDLILTDAKSGVTTRTWHMNAIQLPPRGALARSRLSASTGRYSNVEYSNKRAHLVGVDIRIFATTVGTKGMIVFYESYWGESTLTLLAFSRVETSKDVIHFETETPAGVARYHLRPTATGGLFNRDDVAHQQGDKDIVLKNRAMLAAVFDYKM